MLSNMVTQRRLLWPVASRVYNRRPEVDMRRLVLALTAVLSLACAGKGKPAGGASAQRPAPEGPAAGGVVPPGMEPQPGEEVTAYDLTREGKPDAWKYTTKADGQERVVRKEKDLNGDGKVDAWELFGPDGTVATLVYDFDFDGKPDATLWFEKDQLVRKDMSFGFDGVPRTFAFYEKGKLVRKERDTTQDGKVDTWEYWENDEIDRIGVDSDGDGQVDKWETRQPKDASPTDAAAAPAAPKK
jgi:hypothetical protein